MKTLVWCRKEKHLDAFKFGVEFANPNAQFTQSVEPKGYWLLIEDDTDGDNMTYWLDHEEGLYFHELGVVI